MKHVLTVLLALLLLTPACLAEDGLGYRFADAQEASELLLSNRDYYEQMNQNDLNYRMQKLDATLEELETLAAA